MDTPVELRPDGRISIDLDGNGKPVTLRWPKIREFKTLIDYADELDDELEEVREITDKLRSDDPDVRSSVTPEEITRYQETRRSVASRFVYRAIQTLGDRKPPEDPEEMPAFTQDMSLPARFQTHWQTVPLGSSNPSTRPR